MSTIPYTLSETAVTVFIDGNTYPVDKSNPQFNIVIEALKNNDVATVRKAINVKQTLVEVSTGRITIEDGTLYCQGEPINHALVPRIMGMLEDGFDVSPLVNFLDNLLDNPSFRAVKELYGFLEACNLPVTSDGCFLAYKVVRNDYTDCYTGKFDNSVGKVCSMPRNEVDEDPNRTCSNGLHVCSQSYIPHYGSFGGSDSDRVMVVKVNPTNVVAVPTDYNNAKMRVCEYEVVDELENENQRIKDDFTNQYETDEEVETIESDTSEFTEDQTDMFEDEEFGDDFFDTEDEEDDFDDVPLPTGEVNSSVLNWQNVWDIHSMLEDGAPLSSIASQFNISARQVGRIRDGVAHSQVKDAYEQFKRDRDNN